MDSSVDKPLMELYTYFILRMKTKDYYHFDY